MTDQELIEFILLNRIFETRYFLDRYEKSSLRLIISSVKQAKTEVLETLQSLGPYMQDWYKDYSIALLNELNGLTTTIRAKLTNDISELVTEAGLYSYTRMNDILSFGGRVAQFNDVSLSAEQIRNLIQQPVGGKILSEWVDSAFDYNTKEVIQKEIMTGLFKGEGYPELVDRISEGLDITEKDVTSLVRTYVQSINVQSQLDVYEANQDIVKGVRWTATLENGYKKSGHGTCLRCAALDGQRFQIGKHPPCPLHVNCRCVLVPITPSWRELGLDMDEIAEEYRPYTIRPDKKIGTGRRNTIIEAGQFGGDYASWFEKQRLGTQVNIVGPRRWELLDSGKIKFSDLVDSDTGRLIPIKELK